MGIGIFGLTTFFSARANLKNGREQRKLQEKLHGQDVEIANQRFEADFDLRQRQFVWTQKEAESALVRRREERMEDFRDRGRRDMEGRTFDRLRTVFNLPPDAWMHDPHETVNSGIKSLRVLLLTPKGVSEEYQGEIEEGICTAVRRYSQVSGHHYLQFPTRAWNGSASPGSWISLALHSLSQETPTLIFRISRAANDNVVIHADMFGFPMGDNIYQDNVTLGVVPNDPIQIAQALSLATLATADMHFLSSYGRMPLLPKILSEFIPQGENMDAITNGLVTAYRQTINALLADMPDVGIYASLEFASALTSLADKSHALEQIKQIEDMAFGILETNTTLMERLKLLYTQVGEPEDAKRLTRLIGNSSKLTNSVGPDMLRKLL